MQWKKRIAPSQDRISTFALELSVPQTVAALLIQRGIEDFHSAKEFFRPEWTHLYDPFKMKDMEPAVVRIQNAMAQKEKVMIFGDYDVDGTTAVALVSSYLKDKITEVLPYIPDRYTEGYGISFKGIDYAHAHGITLIIALDCGIKAIDQVAYAHSLGIDFIICDHHLPGLELPGAVAVLDPKREDCEYPFKELCGCGIGFKLIQALQYRLGLPEEVLHSYLDLVATAIAADIVPMVGENRTLTYFGLKRLREQPRVGLQVFTKELKRSLGVSDLVFVLAPRINAAGRMEQGLSAVELLMSTEMETALPIARSIEFFNSERKSTEGRITEEALQQIELEEQHTNSTTVVYHPSWHKGVIGIVASRLIEHFYRPTIVLTQSNEVLAGSVRSVSGFDVYQALEACKETMIQFGGHKYAAGLTLKPEQLTSFKAAFETYVSQHISPEQKEPSTVYDLEVSFSELSPKLYRITSQMAPFGPNNMRPVFVTHQCRDTGRTRAVGKEQTHLKFEIKDSFEHHFTGIGFGLAHYLPEIKKQNPFSILYTLEENQFNGQVSLQLKVKDLQFKELKNPHEM